MNGKLQLTDPKQVAVIQAFQRIAAAMALEAAQIAETWKQPGIAAALKDLIEQIDRLTGQYLQDIQRTIVVASEVPPALVVAK